MELARVLQHRYGDGSVYLPRTGGRQVLRRCMQLGLVSDEGFITKKGRELLAHCGL
jgi:hypothetical protein